MPNDHEVPLAPKKEQQDSLEENILPSSESSTAQFKEGGARGWMTALGGYCIETLAPLCLLTPGW